MKPSRSITAILICLTIWVVAVACAPALRQVRPAVEGRPTGPSSFFATLDAAVAEYGVRNASAFAVPGFPYLRVNRFLDGLSIDAVASDAGNLWIESMRRLDRYGRRQEIRNLPDAVVTSVIGVSDPDLARAELDKRVDNAGRRLLAYDRRQPDFAQTLKVAAAAPSEYSTAMRVLGLYPLFVIPFGIGTEHAYFRFRQWHNTEPEELPVEGTLITYVPATGVPDRGAALDILRSRSRDAFGLPRLSAADEQRLLEAFAPVIVQDVAADHDRFGAVHWRDSRIDVRIDRPTVYHYLTYTHIGNDPVVQLNYAFWYTARAGRRPPTYEKGPLDGLTVRINLDLQGRADLVDIINNCGCYYLIIPRRERIQLVTPTFSGLYPFVPTYLPEDFPYQPLTLRIISGWHQIERVSAELPPAGSVQKYQLRPYDQLESLPRADGSRASAFTEQGIMNNSERIEPYLFFSMGIPKIGYMRQRSHHAIELVGRAHFTDSDLYNRYFEFRP